MRATPPSFLLATTRDHIRREAHRTNARDSIYPEATWNNLGRPFEEAEPASCIDWHAASAYARWLSLRTGAAYRLPTESEFEHALRAGSSTRYHFGDDEEALCRYGNVRDASFNAIYPAVPTLRCDDGYAALAPVGKFQPNAFGV